MAGATRARRIPAHRQIRLVVHLSSGAATWAITRRTTDGDRTFDTRLDSGVQRPPLGGATPEVALLELVRALRAACAARRIPWPEASREPLGAVGGGSPEVRALIEEFSGVSTDGQPLDTPLPGL